MAPNYLILENVRRFKGNNAPFQNRCFFPGSRITADTLAFIANSKCAKTRQHYVAIVLNGRAYLVENHFYEICGLGPGQSDFLVDRLCQISPCNCRRSHSTQSLQESFDLFIVCGWREASNFQLLDNSCDLFHLSQMLNQSRPLLGEHEVIRIRGKLERRRGRLSSFYPLRDQQQLARSLPAFHRRMRLGGIRKRVCAANFDVDVSATNPVE